MTKEWGEEMHLQERIRPELTHNLSCACFDKLHSFTSLTNSSIDFVLCFLELYEGTCRFMRDYDGYMKVHYRVFQEKPFHMVFSNLLKN